MIISSQFPPMRDVGVPVKSFVLVPQGPVLIPGELSLGGGYFNLMWDWIGNIVNVENMKEKERK